MFLFGRPARPPAATLPGRPRQPDFRYDSLSVRLSTQPLQLPRPLLLQAHQEVLDRANLPSRTEIGLPEDKVIYACANQVHARVC